MIDWSQVTTLRDELGEDSFAEIAAMFLEEVDEAVARLPDQTAPGDLAAALHFLKGCALNLGFRDFAALCAEAETQCKSGADAGGLPQIANSYAASRELFVAGLASRPD